MNYSLKNFSNFAVGITCSVGLAGFLAPSAALAGTVISSTPGIPVNPGTYNVFLDNNPLIVPVTVTVPATPTKLDLFLNLDLSGSFNDDLPVLRNSVVPALINNFCKLPNNRCGVSSFVDKPVSPFGVTNFDYVYKTDLLLTSDTSLVQSTVNRLSIRHGGDLSEGQLESLLQIGVRADEIGFRDDAFKVVVLTTDAAFHKAGDGASSAGDPDGNGIRGIQKPNNGDAVLDIGSFGPGTGEDYPSIAQAKAALTGAKGTGIVPIFAVTSDVISTYQSLVNELGFGTVVELNFNSSNLVDAIKTGLDNIFRDITLIAVDDDFGYVNSIMPNSFTGVPTGESRTFNVSLLSNGTGSNDTLRLVAPGFGETVVNVNVDNDNVSVPEPSSGLGILAMGALGAGSILKRKQKQSA